MPGERARLKGRVVDDVAFWKPAEGVREAEEAVRRSCKNWGFVVDVYCPGRS